MDGYETCRCQSSNVSSHLLRLELGMNTTKHTFLNRLLGLEEKMKDEEGLRTEERASRTLTVILHLIDILARHWFPYSG